MFSLETLRHEELSGALADSRIDIGLAFDPRNLPGITGELLGYGRFVVLAPSGMDLGKEGVLRLEDLAGLPFIKLDNQGPLDRFLTTHIESSEVVPVVAGLHFVWQRWCDRRESDPASMQMQDIPDPDDGEDSVLAVYAFLPLLPLVLLLGTAALLTGSGNAALFSFAGMIPGIAGRMNASVESLILPSQFAGGLFRSFSPVAGVIIAVAGTANVTPFAIIKRTSVPMVGGVIATLVASHLLI